MSPPSPQNSRHFSGRSALVTGAASGIGASVARALHRAGAHVWALDIDEAGLEALRNELGHARIQTSVLDVTDADGFRNAVNEVVRAHSTLDFCFNNAGLAAGGPFQDMSIETCQKVAAVNFGGVLNGTHAAYAQMCKQRRGHIINISSMAGLHPVPFSSVYSGTKHAVVGLSLSLRHEGEQKGVRVSVVCPGVVDTGIFDSARDAAGYSYERVVSRLPQQRVSTEQAAKEILEGVAENDALILFPRMSKAIHVAQRVAPRPLTRLIGWMMRP